MKFLKMRKFVANLPIHMSPNFMAKTYFFSHIKDVEVSIDKSGFSSILEESKTSIAAPSRFILSPRLFERSPIPSPPVLTRISDVSSPDIDLASYANTPGGKRLKSRLNELMHTLGTTKHESMDQSFQSPNDSLLLSNASQPDFSNIDF